MNVQRELRLARNAIKYGDLATAKSTYHKILKKYPGNVMAQKGLLGVNKISRGQNTENEKPASSDIDELVMLYSSGNLLTCLEHTKSLLSQFPASASLFNILGAAQKALGNIDEALLSYKKSIELDPSHAQTHNNLGNLLKGQNKTVDAIHCFKSAISINANFSEAYFNLGNAYKDIDNITEAKLYLSAAIKINPNFAEAFNNLAGIYIKTGELKIGLEHYSKALSLLPSFQDALENLQNIFVQLSQSNLKIEKPISELVLNSDEDVKIGPRFSIQSSIYQFLQGKFESSMNALKHFNSFSTDDLEVLSPQNRVFCLAYRDYLTELLKFEEPKCESQPLPFIFHMGDSHCLSTAHQQIKIGGVKHKIIPKIVFGAKAFHLRTKEKNVYSSIASAHFSSIPLGSKIILSFGEIDCRANEGINLAAVKLNKTIDEVTKKTIEHYIDWLLTIRSDATDNVFLCNVPAPKYRSTQSATRNENNALTVETFNHHLQNMAVLKNIKVLDVYKISKNADGFSNNVYHIDEFHLSPKIVVELSKQLV